VPDELRDGPGLPKNFGPCRNYGVEIEQTAVDAMMPVLQRLQLMLQTPAGSGELLSQFADPDANSHQQLVHDVTTHHMLDSVGGQYDVLGCEFMTHSVMAADSTLADSEMVSAGADMGLPDFEFPPLDVTMTDDGMAMPDLLNISTLSADIAHLMY